MEAQLLTVFEKALYHSAFKKCTFSRPKNKEEIRTVATLFLQKQNILVRCESFYRDGKAIQKNLPHATAAKELALLAACYRQINILTEDGDCEIRISEKGKIGIFDKIKSTEKEPQIAAHNREKEYLIDTDAAFSFLHALGIMDANGRIIDKKRAKFKQINRFLEFVEDALPQLPQNATLTIWDLCCGKSYLTFAVYFYLVVQKKYSIQMHAVDRKKDVIATCQLLAKKLSFDNLHFYCMDINDFQTESTPDMVLSLHACDVATDIVLAHAIKNKARVILSSPCCHHEMNGQIDCPSLSFIEKHSILKQKLCDAATDALRCLRLEAEGYQVHAIEFIDPDDTPKNVLIRAYRKHTSSVKEREEKLQQYNQICEQFSVFPYLKKLLDSTQKETSDL